MRKKNTNYHAQFAFKSIWADNDKPVSAAVFLRRNAVGVNLFRSTDGTGYRSLVELEVCETAE